LLLARAEESEHAATRPGPAARGAS
jgi:hypothetical protein